MVSVMRVAKVGTFLTQNLSVAVASVVMRASHPLYVGEI